jgi:hypothetical protein
VQAAYAPRLIPTHIRNQSVAGATIAGNVGMSKDVVMNIVRRNSGGH